MGLTLTHVADSVGVSIGTLISRVDADSDRSARARQARARTARMWDEKATTTIELAADQFELAKAKEMAHHYRRRASKVAPREYGERVVQEVVGVNDGPVKSEVALVGLEELRKVFAAQKAKGLSRRGSSVAVYDCH
jgi:hypothetical protein